LKKVAVFGKGSLAISVCECVLNSSSHELVCVIPVMPEPEWTDSLFRWCYENKINGVSDGDYSQADPESFDLGISVFYDKIFSSDYIDRCQRLINIHNAPLPKYRGMAPINWALKNKEVEHGVTIHDVLPGIDNGPIISQVKYSIFHETEEVIDVYKKSLNFANCLFRSTLHMIDEISPREQDDSLATYYSMSDMKKLGDRRSFTRKVSV